MNTPCPPRMSDGRLFTASNAATSIPQNMSSNEMRRYLVENATQIIEEQRRFGVGQDKRCQKRCFELSQSGTMVPENSYVVCGPRTCTVQPGHPDGVGQGRRYVTSITPI
jgi:hypothetical protein